MTFALVSKERCFGTDTIVSSLNIAYSASIPSRLAPSRSVSQVVRAQRSAKPARMEGADDAVARRDPCYPAGPTRDSLIKRINSLMARFNSLLGRNKFPVPVRREFRRKPLNLALDW